MKLLYSMVVEPTSDTNFFGVYVPDLPGCTTTGNSIEDAIKAGQEAIEDHVALLRELGKPVPPPSFRPVVKILTEEGDVPPEWVKMSAAVQILGMSESSIRRYIKEKRLSAYRHARDYRFDMKDLKRFIEESRVN